MFLPSHILGLRECVIGLISGSKQREQLGALSQAPTQDPGHNNLMSSVHSLWICSGVPVAGRVGRSPLLSGTDLGRPARNDGN